jgi:hypothetical protein
MAAGTQNFSNMTYLNLNNTENELEQHIASKDWQYVNTKRRGSNDYNAHIGLLRIMFGVIDEPEAITTLLAEDKTEVWVQQEKMWNRIY